MSDVAKAYIQLVPSAQGIKGVIEKELGSEAEASGVSAGNKFSASFGGALKGIGTVVAGALAAGAAAAGKLVNDAVKGYGDFEQLAGGVDTLFQGAAGKVQEYASQAYKTAGLSANQYMETVTSFSASLLQSLGGDTYKAADVADMAIRDMADNANKMGTSIESIQNAYQGFAKQNYTMLDNLKLGYGGTKQEMERLLEDATKLSGVEYDIDSLNDVYEAIHVIQENLGITGTTAKEAGETIQGSLASMKSAWENLVSGLANPDADLGQLVSQFADSAKTMLQNLLPAIKESLKGIGQLIQELAPVITEALPGLIKDVLPGLVEAALAIVQAIIDTLNDDDAIDALIDAAVEIILTIADALADNIDKVIEATAKVIVALIEKLTEEETLKKLIDAALKLIVALAKGLLEAAYKIIEALAKVFEKMLTAIGEWEKNVFEAGKQLVQKIGEGIANAAKEAVQWGRDLIDSFVQGIKDRIQSVVDSVKEIAQTVKDYLGFSEPDKGPLSDFSTYAPDMIDLFTQGIRQGMTGVESSALLFADTVSGAMQQALAGDRRLAFATAGDTGAGYYVQTAAGSRTPNINLSVNLDSQTIARATYDANRAESNRIGNHAIR